MAVFVEWDNKYSVNIKQVDDEHKHLIDIINDLFDACTRGKEAAEEKFRLSIKDVVGYVKTHFSNEEDLMIKHNYPDYQNHKKQHELFVMKLLEEVARFEEGKQFVPNHFVRFLKEWLLEHIAVTDKAYQKFFEEKGVK